MAVFLACVVPLLLLFFFFFFQAEDGIRDLTVTGVQTCALPIWSDAHGGSCATARPRRPSGGSGWGRPLPGVDRRASVPRVSRHGRRPRGRNRDRKSVV